MNYMQIISANPHAREYLRWLAEAERPPSTTAEAMHRVFLEVLAPGIAEQERFAVAAFDSGLRLIDVSVLFVGGVQRVAVDTPTVLRWALTRSRPCTSLAVAHNHPSGDPTPSPEDWVWTRRLQRACDVVDVTFLDHLVLGAGKYSSMANLEVP